jgi:CO/xanthine dehydrogenase Mo-binding subunit
MVLVLWAAKRLGRPVKWTSERREGFLTDEHGRDNVSSAEISRTPPRLRLARGVHGEPKREDVSLTTGFSWLAA